jgi:hypothetical protein
VRIKVIDAEKSLDAVQASIAGQLEAAFFAAVRA